MHRGRDAASDDEQVVEASTLSLEDSGAQLPAKFSWVHEGGKHESTYDTQRHDFVEEVDPHRFTWCDTRDPKVDLRQPSVKFFSKIK